MCALARYVMCDALNPAITSSVQWFERTLDDSANKRISVSEAILAVDAILNIYINVTDGLVVYDKVIERRVMEKLPYMATENILMESVKRGGNRQLLHERIRELSHEATRRVKIEGGSNNLIEKIAEDEAFPLTMEDIKKQLNPALYVGRAPSQVLEFNEKAIKPIIDRYYKGKIEGKLEV